MFTKYLSEVLGVPQLFFQSYDDSLVEKINIKKGKITPISFITILGAYKRELIFF